MPEPVSLVTDCVRRTAAALLDPVRALGVPGERIFWGYLLGAALLAAGVWAARARGRGPLWRYLLPARIWRHRSARLDLRLLFARAALEAALFAPLVVSSSAIAFATLAVLVRWLGAGPLHGAPGWVVVVSLTGASFVLEDLVRYLLHRASHRVPFLWELHKLHHSAEVLTPLTVYRTHPIEALLMRTGSALAVGVAAGLVSWAFGRGAALWSIAGVHGVGLLWTALGANLRHSHVWLSYGPFVERLLISPAQHQVHHSRRARHHDRNFGAALALWDWAFGTLYVTRGRELLRLGLPASACNHRNTVTSALLGPLGAALRTLAPGTGACRARRPARAIAAGLLLVAALAGPAHGQPEAEAAAEPEPVEAPVPDAERAPLAAPAPPALADGDPAGPASAEESAVAPEPPAAPAPPAITEVKVSGQRRRREKRGSVHELDARQLERANQDDPQAVLNTVPGVYARGEDGFGLRPNIGARGVNADRSKKINLTEDGVLFGPAPYSAPAAYFFPLITRVHEVEAIKGPAILGHGPQTVAGAVNLVTRPIPEARRFGVDLAGGQYGHGKAHGFYGDRWGGLGVLVEGVHLRSTGFKALDGGGDTGFARNDLMLKAAYTFGRGGAVEHALRLKLGYADEISNESYLGLTREDFARTPLRRYRGSQLDRMRWDRTQAELGYELSSDRLDVVATAYRNDLDRTWNKVNGLDGAALPEVLREPTGVNGQYLLALKGELPPGFTSQGIVIGPNARRFVSQGIQARADWHESLGGYHNRLTLAARLHHDRARRHHSEHTYEFLDGVLSQRPGSDVVSADDRTATLAGSAFLADELVAGRLTVTPAVRLELIDADYAGVRGGQAQAIRRRYHALLPGLGAHYRLWGGLSGVAGVYRGFSPLSVQQPGAQPERSTNFETGVRFEDRRARAEVMGFWNAYDNLTAICTESAGCLRADAGMQTDAGRARGRGVEVLAQLEPRAGRSVFPLLLSYTFTDASFLRSFESTDPIFGSVRRGEAIPYVPRHQLALTGALERPRWGGSASFLLVGRMQDTPGPDRQGRLDVTDTLHTLDLNGYLDLPGGFRAYVNVRNLLDQAAIVSYRPFGARPNAPRWAILGLRYGF